MKRSASMSRALQDVFRALALSKRLHGLQRPATASAWARFDSEVRGMPADFRSFYTAADGGRLCKGNLSLSSLVDGDFAVVQYSARMRGWEWKIPDELVLFANNGGEESFGVWRARPGSRALIVEVGEMHQPRCMAVVGTSFTRFLRGRLAYYLQLYGAPSAALDALGVPEVLREKRPSDETFQLLATWADPGLKGMKLSSYQARLRSSDIRRIARR